MNVRARVRLGLALGLCLGASALGAQSEAEKARAAKAALFDGKYAEARSAWQALAQGGSPEAADAPYWIARCSENLGEKARAFREYSAYLERRPGNAALAEEARTARVGLAAKLYQAGQHSYLGTLQKALDDESRTVRYFAALQLSHLGGVAGAPAVPVLRSIVATEKDPDLVDRAKLGLLRLDPKALQDVRPGTSAARSVSWIKVRIYDKGSARPEVSINLPVALAEMVFTSLPDKARDELRRKGYDPDNFWERLKKMGPSEILTIEGKDGERIQIWME